MTSLPETVDNQPAGKPRRARRGTRLPEDWRRAPEDVAWQRKEGIPDAFARISTANFCDYWHSKPGVAGEKLDWSRTWKRWLRTDWYERCTERRRNEWLRIQAERDMQTAGQQRVRVPEALAR